MAEKDVGITVKKDEDFNEWYSQVVIKSDLVDYSSVSGCIVFKPGSYEIWEKIRDIFDKRIKKSGHRNCYFPLFIPEKLLVKEKDHIEGFTPEVAWVTHAGEKELDEKLAIRPTSETIMYESYAKWIRSWRDLPLLLNQWNNVVRWEFKHPKPFLRTREFLWQEGHTAHADEKDAEREVMQQLFEYVDLVENHMAIPVLAGKKTEKEKFAGAVYTTAIESLMPDGKGLQMGTSHQLGQNFAKPFGIKFLDKDEKEKHVWTTSWGLSTRTIGAIIMVHGDDKGLVLPPKIAPLQVAMIPIMFKDTKEEVVSSAKELAEKMEGWGYSVKVDDREIYTPGWKFNDWEMKGVPLRVEIGPKDIENKQVVVVRRDTSEKLNIKIKDLEKKIGELLDDIQTKLFEKAKKFLDKSIVEVKNFEEFMKGINKKKLVFAQFCGSVECEDEIKDKAEGAEARVVPFEQKKANGKCVGCGKEGKVWCYFGKGY